MTVEDFLRPEAVSIDRTWGRGRSDAILNAVARWTEDAETAQQIGLRLGVTRRTVNRLQARCREPGVMTTRPRGGSSGGPPRDHPRDHPRKIGR